MGERDEACERLLDNIEDAIASLERGKDECEMNDWELFAPEDLEEIIEQLRLMAGKLNIKITELEEFVAEE
jgi:hypothetical protein